MFLVSFDIIRQGRVVLKFSQIFLQIEFVKASTQIQINPKTLLDGMFQDNMSCIWVVFNFS